MQTKAPSTEAVVGPAGPDILGHLLQGCCTVPVLPPPPASAVPCSGWSQSPSLSVQHGALIAHKALGALAACPASSCVLWATITSRFSAEGGNQPHKLTNLTPSGNWAKTSPLNPAWWKPNAFPRPGGSPSGGEEMLGAALMQPPPRHPTSRCLPGQHSWSWAAAPRHKHHGAESPQGFPAMPLSLCHCWWSFVLLDAGWATWAGAALAWALRQE